LESLWPQEGAKKSQKFNVPSPAPILAPLRGQSNPVIYGHKKAQNSQREIRCLLPFRQNELFHVENRRSEVDQQGMLFARCPQVAQNLGDMLAGNRLGGFEFDDQLTFDQKIHEKLAKKRAVLVVNIDRMLLLDQQAKLAQTMRQTIFVDLLEVAVAKIAMNRKTGLPDHIT
jgi:hypothetical protein